MINIMDTIHVLGNMSGVQNSYCMTKIEVVLNCIVIGNSTP